MHFVFSRHRHDSSWSSTLGTWVSVEKFFVEHTLCHSSTFIDFYGNNNTIRTLGITGSLGDACHCECYSVLLATKGTLCHSVLLATTTKKYCS